MGSKVETNGGAAALVSAKVPPLANSLAEKPDEIASNISYHAQYSPHFSPFKFHLEQAYYATVESICDRHIQDLPFSYIEGEELMQEPIIFAKTVTNTIGAGDTFTVAFVVALVEGKSKKECLRFFELAEQFAPNNLRVEQLQFFVL